jgi:hypothetical protein
MIGFMRRITRSDRLKDGNTLKDQVWSYPRILLEPSSNLSKPLEDTADTCNGTDVDKIELDVNANTRTALIWRVLLNNTRRIALPIQSQSRIYQKASGI